MKKIFYNHKTLPEYHYVDILKKLVRDIEIKTLRKVHGYDSVVLIINNSRVFKFAQRLEVFDHYKTEMAVFPFLEKSCNFEIPKIVKFYGEFDEIDNFILEYEIMPGNHLTLEIREKNLSNKDLKKIGLQIGRNLKEIHSLDFRELMDLGVEFFDKDKWRKQYEFVNNNCMQFWDLEQQRWVKKLYEDFLEIWDKQTFSPVFVHGDIGSWHVFSRDLEVVGFLDWGGMRIDDPAADLRWHGDENKILKETIQDFFEIDKYFFERREFYRERMAVSKFIKGVQQNDEQRITDGYALLEKMMNN